MCQNEVLEAHLWNLFRFWPKKITFEFGIIFVRFEINIFKFEKSCKWSHIYQSHLFKIKTISFLFFSFRTIKIVYLHTKNENNQAKYREQGSNSVLYPISPLLNRLHAVRFGTPGVTWPSSSWFASSASIRPFEEPWGVFSGRNSHIFSRSFCWHTW